MSNLKSFKIFATIMVTLFLSIGVVVTTYSVQQKTNLKSKAAENQSKINDDIINEDIVKEYKYPSEFDRDVKPQTTVLKSTSLGSSPNIIVIITDDQPPNTIGLAGNPVIKTPNIDNLGRNGAYFKNMYLPIGQCAPSRASIWTGKLPHSHGVTTNGLLLPNNLITLPEILKDSGYNTAFIGKCHLGDAKERFQFDYRIETDAPAPADHPNNTYETWYNYNVLRNGVLENRPEYITDFLTNEAVSYIKSTKRPFFLWLAHPAPHLPTTPPRGSNRYSIDQIPTPVSIIDDSSTKPPQQQISTHQFYLRKGWPAIKSLLKDAYETITNLDDNTGKLIRTLDDLKIRDNTIIIYLSDNGLMYGEHQQNHKGPTFYEEQIKTPFIFSYPKLVSKPKVIDSLSSSIDILPTLLDILNISQPQGVQGKSFKAVLTGETISYRNSVYMEYANQGKNDFPMRGVVMDGFKWVHYLNSTVYGKTFDGFDYELYDLKRDPFEMNNILKRLNPSDQPLERMLKDPTYGKIIQKLRKERAVWATDTSDPSRFSLIDGRVISPNSTTLLVHWNAAAGGLGAKPTAEIEYQEKNCSSCPILQYNDFSHKTGVHDIILSNLKPKTSYRIRAFSFGVRGVGGYVDLEGTTQ